MVHGLYSSCGLIRCPMPHELYNTHLFIDYGQCNPKPESSMSQPMLKVNTVVHFIHQQIPVLYTHSIHQQISVLYTHSTSTALFQSHRCQINTHFLPALVFDFLDFTFSVCSFLAVAFLFLSLLLYLNQ